MDNINEVARQLFKELSKHARNEGSFAPIRGEQTQFVRDGDGAGRVNEVQRVEEQTAKVRKSMEDLQKGQKKLFKSMLDGVPAVGKFYQAFNKGTRSVEEYSKGQSEAYKRSAEATSKFVSKVGQNSQDLDKYHKTLGTVYEATDKLARSSQKRVDLENKILSSIQETSLQGRKIAKDYRNVEKLISDAEKKLEKSSDPAERSNLKTAIEGLQELKDVPDAIKELRNVVNDRNLKKEMAGAPVEIRSRYEKMQKTLEELLKRETPGGGRVAATPDEIIAAISDLDEVVDEYRGSVDALNVNMHESAKMIRASNEKLRESMENLGKALGAAIGEAFFNETRMLLTRQRLTGAPLAYAERSQALAMGMSETDTLTAVAENRFLLRRMADQTGMATGAGDLLRSGGLNRLQDLSYEMGLMGKEALENLLKVSDDLRVVGVDLNKANMASAVGFIRDTFKDLGVTQEQMRQFFGEMTTEGMLGTMAAGDARIATLEAMQEEVKFRGQLARVLNQELEIQKKRVQQLTQLAYGDPAAALRQSVFTEILAGETGMSQQETLLMGEFVRTGGRGMGEGRRQQAANVFEEMNRKIGGLADQFARTDDFGGRAVLSQLVSGSPFEMMDAVDAYIRRGGDTSGTSLSQIRGYGTEEPAMETNELLRTGIRTAEGIQGAIHSAIGKSTVAIVSAIGSLAASMAMGGLGGAMARGGTRGLGRKAKGLGKAALRFGKVATPLGLGTLAISQLAPSGSAIGSTATGAGIGATIGSVVPGIGTAIGAGVGGLAGMGYGMYEGEKGRAIDTLVADQATGGFGRETVPHISKERRVLMEERRKAVIEGDREKLDEIERTLTFGKGTEKTRSMMSNIHVLRDKQKENATGFGIFGRYDEAGLKEQERIETEIGRDITNFMETGEYKKVGDVDTLNKLVETLKKDIDVESEDDFKQQLLERIDFIKNASADELDLLKEQTEDQKQRYSDMSEKQIREHLENKISGMQSGVMEGILGRASEYGRE